MVIYYITLYMTVFNCQEAKSMWLLQNILFLIVNWFLCVTQWISSIYQYINQYILLYFSYVAWRIARDLNYEFEFIASEFKMW